MALFDGGRWDRIRNAGWSWHRKRGRVIAHAEINMHAICLPKLRIGVYAGEPDKGTLHSFYLGIAFGDYWNDDGIVASMSIEFGRRWEWLFPKFLWRG